ncbi:sigma-54-dependent Fis family transcriptional regulator [Sporosarcina luteola]|uniref:Sigma-54-dependent Fis family transcriptional regulator n=1 Tax=Sporosarcina luteola TaxID=582850 RepID=A0A511Z9V6_9BACL|nr:sigma 54-interacting transcriptional regulator [Sporosarcina luteola]GEN84235.1 sigma-54-dependent Fis family transcriptional regulator [Sporosarcina luteola]
MQNVLIVGAGSGGTIILNLLLNLNFMNVKAIVDKDEQAPGLHFARKMGIKHGSDWKPFLTEDIQIVFDVTGDKSVVKELMESIPAHTLLIPGTVANLLVGLLNENDRFIRRIQTEMDRQRLIFNSIDEGMIGIDRDGIIDFINESACKMLEVSDFNAIGKSIFDIIPESKLVRVLQSGKAEVNDELILPNGLEIISSRYPLISADGDTFGAFAVFKDISEVVKLAEEIIDLKSVKTMLEAIIHSSDDAISVVDENGNGVLVNPAYTRITGLSEDEVIGKPATVDINEGESIHMKVLKTKKPIRGVNMRIGEDNRDVIVNVAPIIVNRQMKGSIGVIHDITEMRSLMRELDLARQTIRKLESTYTFADIHGSSPDIDLAIDQARIAAKSDIPVLLRGEAGSGKELFANAIHSESSRKSYNFIRVNCGAIDPSAMEKELFGESGRYDSNKPIKPGLFEEAVSGSIFLDEVTDLPLTVQVRLLSYLKQRMLQMNTSEPVRIIAATSKNLEKAIHEGTFHTELYYALTRITIQIPPLRTRKSDIPEVVNHLLTKVNQEFGMNVETISDEAMNKLQQYDWPGNVRELENVLSRAMIYIEPASTIIKAEDIKKSLFTNEMKTSEEILPEKSTLASVMDDYERSVLEKALDEHNGNKSLTANRLGISLRSLYYKLEKYKLI